MSALTDAIRAEYKYNDDRRDEGLVTPDDVERIDDICYGEDENWQVMDIYLPKNGQTDETIKKEKLPVIISVHGGAWVYGTKETYQFYCMGLARRGFAVINFTYRLAPEFKFPASVEDTNLVMKYVMENADKYGFDTDRIFAVGDSAGGHLLAIYTTITTNPEYAKYFDIKVPEGFKLRAVGLNFGKYTFAIDDHISNEGDARILEELLQNKGTEEEMKLINVLDHINSDFPETFIVTAQDDFLKTQSVLLAGKLAEVKVPFTLKCYGDSKNSLYHVFHCDQRSEAAKKCNDEECEFFIRL
ncbi:Acetyl esterase/lipase [Eubacterium ruminantium]|nr:Acetyl esterase/lipase [Eubacterium ruminantium]